jgi:hypothetical protein
VNSSSNNIVYFVLFIFFAVSPLFYHSTLNNSSGISLFRICFGVRCFTEKWSAVLCLVILFIIVVYLCFCNMKLTWLTYDKTKD